ncbi:MAG: ATP-binding protein [Saprospiraceae bacterium]
MPVTQQFNEWLDHSIYRPDLEPEALVRKKMSWIWTAGACFCVLLMTLLALVFKVWILVWFGIVLLIGYAIVLPLTTIARNFERVQFYFLLGVIFATFITILKLGGIMHSMGLVFAGLVCAMASVLSKEVKRTVIVFAFYAATILAAGLLQPFLTIPTYITPSVNLLFHVINILWMTGTTLMFITDYIKQRSLFEEEKSKHLRELDETKTRLYTNITHEFRTPLTIIMGMSKQLKEEIGNWEIGESGRGRHGPSTSVQSTISSLDMIRRNGQSLLTLVNQMLDMQKVDAGLMAVHPVQGNVIPFLAYLSHSFASLADSKKIQLEFHTELDSLVMDYDPDKLQNILSNLLTNAIKFTPDGGLVQLTVGEQQFAATNHKMNASNGLMLTVKDTGIGIAESHLPHVFDRFFQVEDTATRKAGGTGIGLALTKELVKLMNGEISVSSQVGKGTAFSVWLPITKQAPFQDINAEALTEQPSSIFAATYTEAADTHDVDNAREKLPLVLVVEDNPDMVRYLTSCLQPEFNFDTAPNGKLGLEKALELIPDLIISDVMMPEMDGFELCGKLKNDFRTSHIPIVVLTAKADMASKLEGLECGADAYLTKPFHREELLVRLRKMIELRKNLQARYGSATLLPPSEDKAVQREDEFMKQVRSIVEANLGDESFGIPELCHALAMSRAQLYRKFEALTNLPVGKYLRTMRLRRAKELLQNDGLNVTEAAFEAGFRNLSHFSTAFKEEFGVNPSEVQH